MFLLSALFLTSSPAMAEEGVLPNIDVELMATAQVEQGLNNVSPTLKATVRTKRDAYVYLDGRVGTAGVWNGRLGAGMDLLGKMPIDLTVGGFAGVGGVVGSDALSTYPEGGAEVAVGGEVGRFRAAYRWRIGATKSPVSIFLMENEANAGIRLVSTLRLEARYIHSYATQTEDGHSLGMGLSYTF